MADSLTSVQPIEAAADAIGSDADSNYDDRSLSTASVTSSIYAFKTENGRTYHSYKQDKTYALPNDEAEQERMDIHYHAIRLTLGNKLHFAPLENPTSALDVGTGTGIWAIDFGDQYPAAEVLGVDLSPIQPGYIPSNCSFQVMDLEDDWDMPNSYDFVHTREMNGFAVKNWPKFYEQAFQALRPGGWVENQEFDLNISSDDNSFPKDSQLIRWSTLWEQGVQKAGMTKRLYPDQMKQQMEAAGFINVKVLPFKMPIGPWPKDKTLSQSGLFIVVGLLEGVSGISLRVYTQLLGWTPDELEVLLTDVRKELKNKKIHGYFPVYVVYGQKPPAT